MVVEVDDVGKAREWLLSESKAHGMAVFPVREVETGHAIALDVEDAGSFLEAARAVNARVLYVTGRHELAKLWDRLLEQEAGDEPRPAGEAPDADGAPAEMTAPMRRTLALLRDVGFVTFHAAFAHEGILHTMKVADREAGLAFEALELMVHQDLEETDFEEDLEEPDLVAMTPAEGARAVLDYVTEQGVGRREMRRDSARLAHRAVRDLVPDLDDLPAPVKARIHQVQQEAERRMRRGA